MPTKLRPLNAIKIGNATQHVKNLLIRRYTPYRITPEGEYYLLDGELIPVKDFNKMYPLDLLPIQRKGCNSDRTKNWIHGQQSF